MPIDIFHMNPDDVPSLVARYSTPERPGTYRIGFALWEASQMPEQHRAGCELMDELWVPTEYLRKVYSEAGFSNVQVVGKGIELGNVEKLQRTEFGIDHGQFVFLSSFEVGSWTERKNPYAAVEAFRKAFPTERDVRLIVKTTGIFSHPGDKTGQTARILDAAEEDDRIILINRPLPFSHYLGLIEMSDCIVSTHRSEGFGYLPAYAMLMAKPVVVTDHSGTEDYCDETTSFPIPARLVPIGRGDFVYDMSRAVWADIDTQQLAEILRHVRNDPADAKKRAAEGQARVTSMYAMTRFSETYRERIGKILEESAAELKFDVTRGFSIQRATPKPAKERREK